MKVFLIRHGEAIKTDTDSVLTKKGIIQAKNIAKILKKMSLDSVFTSNLTRSKQTLNEYKKINPSIKTNINEELNEIYRVIVGGPIKEGASKDREKKDISRANNFFKNLIASKEGNVAVFTHGNLIKFFWLKYWK